ncbi:MAG: GNAT family N-acetyltransferase [Nocardioides sp.]
MRSTSRRSTWRSRRTSTFTSSIAFPLFNGAVNAQFEPGDAVRRAHEVLDRLTSHGFPFLWWLTPNTRSPELEAVLVERGLVTEGPDNAMSVDLRDLPVLAEQPPAGVTIEAMTAANVDEVTNALLAGFGMPTELAEPFKGLLTASSSDRVTVRHVLARLDGRPVGAGTVAVSDNTVAGLYNIAVRDEARGRGVGRAVTVELMRIGAGLGCTESILHATARGEPVYAKLGYVPVAQVQLYLWTPDA